MRALVPGTTGAQADMLAERWVHGQADQVRDVDLCRTRQHTARRVPQVRENRRRRMDDVQDGGGG
eukprot:2927954-Rhodomonas_salina.1